MMFFKSLVAALPLLAVGVQSIALPVANVTPVERSLEARCGTCASGPGDLDLSIYTDIQLNYLKTCNDALAQIVADVSIAANLVEETKLYAIDIATGIVAWSTADLNALVTALTHLAAGVSTCTQAELTLLAQAGIDVATVTIAEINCVKIYINVVLKATFNLTASVKATLLAFGKKCILFSASELVTVKTNIEATIQALYDVVIAVKTQLKTEVKAFLDAHVLSLQYVLFNTVYLIVSAWVSGAISTVVSLCASLNININFSIDIYNAVCGTLAPYGFTTATTIDTTVWDKVLTVI